ncbi:hypothetical protein KDA_74650 [Dictyobacter alpinus]|uniref:GIY-YIG domain-containing protein n=1 Tax=Dictyobacter alpinus TaxID=2014873 RepID=A0A402BKW4_9CHLR|nr:hypothetical protein [Dictyobacter alpinus]GCE31981.1 hypothetical protein KDA_74650 [Dictyobacter alpinus]
MMTIAQHELAPFCLERVWSTWQNLEGSWREARISTCPGLYRIRIVISLHDRIFPFVVYIGQSGDLRTRMGHLKGVFGIDMPFKSPHIAGPPLWAIRQRLRQERVPACFEVSVMELRGVPKSQRLGYECVAIARHRKLQPHRFLANFGRMPRGYIASTFNKGAGSFRGYPSPARNDSHLQNLALPGDLERGLPGGLDWCGLSWSHWALVQDAALSKEVSGLYRIRQPDRPTLLYLGQGIVRERINPYRKMGVECSWVGGQWREHERLELLNDIIASHVLCIGQPPTLQFPDDEAKGKL